MQEFDFYSPDELCKISPRAHPSALIARGAEIDENVALGPNSFVGPEVKLAAGVKLGLGASVTGNTFIGADTEIYSYATIGTTPQDLKYDGEKTSLKIGNNNQIREYVNISIGTKTGHGETVIGNNNLFMAYSHIAHDCIVGDNVILANGVQMAGHVEAGDNSVFGGLVGIHQFCKIGAFVMVGAGAIVVKDVLPFSMVQGDRARPVGLNVVGLKRGPFSKEEVASIKQAYKIVYNRGLAIEAACEQIQSTLENAKIAKLFIEFIRNSDRGIVR